MRAQEVEQRLRDIFATVLELNANEVAPELRPESCAKWDSLRHIHLVNAIDEEFGVSLDFAQQMELTSFGKTVEIVYSAISRQP